MSGSVLVETVYGPVRGIDDDSGHCPKTGSTGPSTQSSRRSSVVRKFLGIPYGQAERWKRVQSPTAWKEPLLCQQFGPSLPQFQLTPFNNFYHVPLQCMSQSVQSHQHGFSVNVFSSPDIREGDKVPVLAWVYGGGLLHGCSSLDIYDPTEWIRREAGNGRKFIVVTGNYRTNLLGFLACSDLVAEDPDGLAGNYGPIPLLVY